MTTSPRPPHEPVRQPARQPVAEPSSEPSAERRHQRDAGAALLLGAVVLALLMVGYVFLHR